MHDSDEYIVISIEQLCNIYNYDITKCRRCGLWNTRKRVVVGTGNTQTADILAIGAAPGIPDQKTIGNVGLSISGDLGAILNEIIMRAEIEPKRLYKTNIIKCIPTQNGKELRKPKIAEIKACRANLLSEISIINPSVIVCLGSLSSEIAIGKGKYRYLTSDQIYASKIDGSIPAVSIEHPGRVYNGTQKDVQTFIKNSINAWKIVKKIADKNKSESVKSYTNPLIRINNG